jgi:AraC-like DNA-binding protein/ABC-type glycerol-3-phosphate transport system substrate-binding protein
MRPSELKGILDDAMRRALQQLKAGPGLNDRERARVASLAAGLAAEDSRFGLEPSGRPKRSRGSGAGFLMQAPNFTEAPERRRYEKALAGVLKAARVPAELKSSLVNTDVFTELYGASTDFGLMLVYEPRMRLLSRQGLLCPLQSLLPDFEKRFHPLALRLAQEGGKLFAAPLFLSTRALFYRKDLLDRHRIKPPRTWDAMEEAAAKVGQDQGDRAPRGLCLDAGYLNRFNLLLDLCWSQGAELFEGEGPWRFNTDAVRKSLSRLLSWLGPEGIAGPACLGMGTEESNQRFLRGEALFCLGWTDMLRLIHEQGPGARARFGVSLMPSEDLGNRLKTRLGGPSYVIPAHSRFRAEASRLLPALLDSPFQMGLLQHAAWPFPAQPGMMGHAAVRKANPYFDLAEDFLTNANLLEERSYLGGSEVNWQNAVNSELESLFGEQSEGPDRLCAGLEKRLKPLLPPRPYQGLVAQAVDLVTREANGPLDVAGLAKRLVVSREHFMREFKRQTGQTALKFIQAKQMEQARIILETTHLHVSEVAQKLGYDNLGHFSRLFKKILGKNPREFKRMSF